MVTGPQQAREDRAIGRRRGWAWRKCSRSRWGFWFHGRLVVLPPIRVETPSPYIPCQPHVCPTLPHGCPSAGAHTVLPPSSAPSQAQGAIGRSCGAHGLSPLPPSLPTDLPCGPQDKLRGGRGRESRILVLTAYRPCMLRSQTEGDWVWPTQLGMSASSPFLLKLAPEDGRRGGIPEGWVHLPLPVGMTLSKATTHL